MGKRPSEKAEKTDEVAQKPLKLPDITHLQFLVLDLLCGDATGMSANALKAGLAEFAMDYSGPKFYQLMDRLMEAGLVTSEARSLTVADAAVHRTYYQITPGGISAHVLTSEFYAMRRRLAEALKRKTRRPKSTT